MKLTVITVGTTNKYIDIILHQGSQISFDRGPKNLPNFNNSDALAQG